MNSSTQPVFPYLRPSSWWKYISFYKNIFFFFTLGYFLMVIGRVPAIRCPLNTPLSARTFIHLGFMQRFVGYRTKFWTFWNSKQMVYRLHKPLRRVQVASSMVITVLCNSLFFLLFNIFKKIWPQFWTSRYIICPSKKQSNYSSKVIIFYEWISLKERLNNM